MPSPTEENYLKALFSLESKKGEVTASELSQSLAVSTPTVNSMAKKLYERGFVEYEKYKPLRLTKLGRKTAALIVRKHRLTEMYLVEKMGFGWEEVHDVAEQIEHIKSPLFFERMNEILGNPSVDPHGSPIPDKEGNFRDFNYTLLSQVPEGTSVIIKGLNHSSADFLNFLDSKNLGLETRIQVKKKESFDQSITVKLPNGDSTMLSQEVTSRIFVTIS